MLIVNNVAVVVGQVRREYGHNSSCDPRALLPPFDELHDAFSACRFPCKASFDSQIQLYHRPSSIRIWEGPRRSIVCTRILQSKCLFWYSTTTSEQRQSTNHHWTTRDDFLPLRNSHIMSSLFGGSSIGATNNAPQQGDLKQDVPVKDIQDDSISSIDFSPAADFLAATSWNKEVRVWEIDPQGNSQPRTSYKHEGPVLDCTWSKVSGYCRLRDYGVQWGRDQQN